ncbi:hypothetical protein [Bradyrhizobium neotropicale]|uniref:hypothetical protein n=1 Tax=Bradyrhizobium neotropicale TaxID=1497615 RepID=UPI001AD67F4B|nr:hypothetical protein [Bradyrhizobium neotropicale]MBO4226635.1 hypothetical protein [Bradyrhizobium neotropicale]
MASQSGSHSEKEWSLRLPGWDFIVKYGPGIAVIVGAAWTVLTWWDQRSEQFRSDEARKTEALQVALRESQKPFLERQLGFYFEAAKVTGTLATRDRQDQEWASARKRFWELYWGELGVVESPEVASAMVAFGQALGDLEKCVNDQNNCHDLQKALTGASITLAHRIRESIETGWGYRLPYVAAKN